jgi:hypothetical protein
MKLRISGAAGLHESRHGLEVFQESTDDSNIHRAIHAPG